MRIICLLLWSWTLLLSSTAQLKTPNDAGISASNVGVLYTDAGFHKQFWTALGGVELDLGKKRFNPFGIPVNPTVFSFPGIAIYGLRGSQQLTLPSTTSASLSVPPRGTGHNCAAIISHRGYGRIHESRTIHETAGQGIQRDKPISNGRFSVCSAKVLCSH